MSKYVIKNCPAQDVLGEGCCYCNQYAKCADSDCLLKRIVEKCRNTQYRVYNKNLEVIGYRKSPLSEEIIKLLEIEECE